MALDTTKGFGYLPNDIIEFISSRCDYDFFAIDEHSAKLIKIDGFAAKAKGANVLCVPTGQYKNRLMFLDFG